MTSKPEKLLSGEQFCYAPLLLEVILQLVSDKKDISFICEVG